MSTENSEDALSRVVGVQGLAATVVNNSIGGSIYALPALIAIQLGVAAIIGYFLCGLMFVTIILCYVEVGSRIKTTGGSYAYVESAFGLFPGFIVNWLFFFGWGILSDAALMNIVADSLSVMVPSFANPLVRALLLLILIGLMLFINVYSAKLSVRFVELITIIKLIPLFAIMIFGFSHVKAANLHWEHLPSLRSFEDSALILFFCFAGFETSLNVSGEIKDPKRTVPRGILLGGILVFSIYILIQLVMQGVLGEHVKEFKDAPLAAVAEKVFGSTGAIIILVAAMISGFATVSGDVLASPRLLYAGAKDGLFPKFLGKIHPRFGTPHLAIIIYCLLIFILSVSGGFKQLAILASGALLLIYLAVVLAMIRLRLKKDAVVEKGFKVPGGMIIPFIAIAAIIWVLSNLSRAEIISLGIFIAVISVIYFVMKKWQSKAGKKAGNYFKE